MKLDQIVGMSGNTMPMVSPDLTMRLGTLESERMKLTGAMVAIAAPCEIHWHASTAAEKSKLDPKFAGKIVYSVPKPPIAKSENVRARAVQGGVAMILGGRAAQRPSPHKA